MMRRPLFRRGGWLLLVVLGAAVSGCGSDSKKPPVGTLEPDKFLWEKGTDNLNRKRWFTAREYFRQLVDSYPQSPYRPDAKLGIADTYLGENSAESNVLGINEYREFLSFYPTHKRAYYAQYKLGMAHFHQMHSSDRDQTETRDAIAELTKYMSLYGSNRGEATADTAEEAKAREDTTEEAKKHLREAKDRYSASEYGTGFFYFKTKWYPGAIERFESIRKSDPEYTNRDAVYFYLAQSYIKVQRPAAALPVLDQLLKEFDHSEYLEEARKLVETLKAELTKKTEGKSYEP